MNRRDLRPLSTVAAKRIDWLAARNEVKINDALLAWHSDAPSDNTGQRALTAERQSELQHLLVEMAVKLGEAEGRERLNVTSSPRQFEFDVEQLMDTVAAEAHERWCCLIHDFRLDPRSAEGQPECDFHLQLREALRPTARRLIRDAWSAHEKRLEAECACPVEENSAGTQTALARMAPAKRPALEMVAQKIERLRVDKGMSVEELAVEARLDKKTVAALIDGRRHARINTVKKLADALGIKASELVS